MCSIHYYRNYFSHPGNFIFHCTHKDEKHTFGDPCKVQSPVLKDIAVELGERVRVIKIDVDQNPEMADRFQMQGVPTLMIFKSGEIKYKQAGVHTKPQLMNVLSKI